MWATCPVEGGVDLWYLHAIGLAADFLELTMLAGTQAYWGGWQDSLRKPSSYQMI